MLYFKAKPDKAFHAIVRESLAWHIEKLNRKCISEDDALWGYCENLKACFTRNDVVTYSTLLLEAHESDKLFRMSAYHYLILYSIIDQAVLWHNGLCGDRRNNGLFNSPRIGFVDFHRVVDFYFWNTDFLFEANIYDWLNAEAKVAIGLDDEIFGIAHGLKPHPEEMALKEIKQPLYWDTPNYLYPPDEPSPYEYMEEYNQR